MRAEVVERRAGLWSAAYWCVDAASAVASRVDPFTPDAWPGGGTPVSAGRGSAWYVGDDDGQYVLRHYRRGGLIALVLRRHYLASGAQRSRSFQEFNVMAALHRAGLPVPKPVAAAYWRVGLFYRAALLTTRLPDVSTLAERLAEAELSAATWRHLGDVVARMHAEGVDHADLNAHNILLSEDDAIHIIDFDRARVRHDHGWQVANVQRLERSLKKLASAGRYSFPTDGWQLFRSSYAEASSSRLKSP